jgi:hypothetical protein
MTTISVAVRRARSAPRSAGRTFPQLADDPLELLWTECQGFVRLRHAVFTLWDSPATRRQTDSQLEQAYIRPE